MLHCCVVLCYVVLCCVVLRRVVSCCVFSVMYRQSIPLPSGHSCLICVKQKIINLRLATSVITAGCKTGVTCPEDLLQSLLAHTAN
jgi:hypothetical protein